MFLTFAIFFWLLMFFKSENDDDHLKRAKHAPKWTVSARRGAYTASSGFQVTMSPRLGQPSAKTHPHLMKEGQVTPMTPQSAYKERRARLMDSLPPDSIVVIPAAKHYYMTNDIPYVYRQNSDFSYLCGLQEPGSVMVLYRGNSGEVKFHLFVRPRSAHSELWDGPRTGVERANAFFGSDETSNVEEFEERFASMLEGKKGIFWRDTETDVANFQKSIEASHLKKVELKHLLNKIRVVKTAPEIEMMRKSCSISSHAFIDTMKSTTPNCSEHVMSAKIEYECRRRGSQRLAYPPVVATGISCNTLHYVMNDSTAKDGDMLLMDAGGEYFDYSSDITRTWPTNGKFTPAQRTVYEAVLRTQKRVIAAARTHIEVELAEGVTKVIPTTLAQLQRLAMESTMMELMEMGIDDEKHLIKCYPHMIGHFLGMDVHDVPSVPYTEPLRPGMIITVEPGLYMPVEDWVPAPLRGIGVRIEDDVLITEGEAEVLTKECPKEIVDLERIIGTNPL